MLVGECSRRCLEDDDAVNDGGGGDTAVESRRRYERRFSMLPEDGDVLLSSAPDLSPSDVGGVAGAGAAAGSSTNGAT